MMTSVRDRRHAAAAAALLVAAGLILLLTAGTIAPRASAQSAEEDKLRSAVLSLKQELAETLVKITPEVLKAQKDLVEELRIGLAGVRDEERVGQRTIEDVLIVQLAYFREREALEVMEARSAKGSISEREVLKVRIGVRSEALSLLQEYVRRIEDRYSVGEVTRTDVALAKAGALKAQIMLGALKSAAGD